MARRVLGAPWLVWVAVSGSATAAYFALPEHVANWLYAGLAVAAAAVVAVAARPWTRSRLPWLGLGAYLALHGVADTIWNVQDLRYGEAPFPSVADVPYLLAYLIAVVAVLGVVRQRGGSVRGSALDAAIVALGFSVLSWVVLISPYATDPSLGLLEKAVALAYPCVDVLLIAVVARVLFVPGRPLPLTLLGVVFSAVLVSDVGYALLVLSDGYAAGHLVDLGWLLSYVLLPAAVLHPARDEPAAETTDLPLSRVLVLGLATVQAPGVLVLEGVRGGQVDVLVLGVLCLVVFALVLARMSQLVRTVSHQAALLEELSDTDDLTGLPNRRYWRRHLPLALAQAARSGEPLCVALIDLDHFKAYNDARGHLAGDWLLHTAATTWRAQLRQQDLLARYGGEEFLAILPGCDAEGGRVLLERLREHTPDGQRCSAGIAVTRGDEDVEALLHRADRALYGAKASGRNRVIVDDAPALAG
jgi:diguanylate cyclase (GGDEF)-like protein